MMRAHDWSYWRIASMTVAHGSLGAWRVWARNCNTCGVIQLRTDSEHDIASNIIDTDTCDEEAI